MKDWNSKIVSVLANYGVVEIKDQKEWDAFKEICNRIGSDPTLIEYKIIKVKEC